jgi:hypothetical protein
MTETRAGSSGELVLGDSTASRNERLIRENEDFLQTPVPTRVHA